MLQMRMGFTPIQIAELYKARKQLELKTLAEEKASQGLKSPPSYNSYKSLKLVIALLLSCTTPFKNLNNIERTVKGFLIILNKGRVVNTTSKPN